MFNIANEESVTLGTLLDSLNTTLPGVDSPPVSLHLTHPSPLPTTDFGPLNVSKWVRAFPQFRFTPVSEWLPQLFQWYTAEEGRLQYHVTLKEQAGRAKLKQQQARAAQAREQGLSQGDEGAKIRGKTKGGRRKGGRRKAAKKGSKDKRKAAEARFEL